MQCQNEIVDEYHKSEEEHFFLASGIQNLIFSTKSLITQCREFKDKKDKKMISNPLMNNFAASRFKENVLSVLVIKSILNVSNNRLLELIKLQTAFKFCRTFRCNSSSKFFKM